MPGKRVALTERDQAICAEVARYGLITRDQLVRLGLFHSKTRANERLTRLTASGYLDRRSQPMPVGGPRFVYLPGRLDLGQREARRRYTEGSDLFLAHQLGLVDVRIAFARHTQLTRWMSDRELGTSTPGLIPDGYVEYDLKGLTYCAFLEYDRGTETLARFERKVHGYQTLAFSGAFARTFRRRFFRVFIITDSPKRLDTLSQTIARTTDRIFWLTTLTELSHHGPLASIWRRPGGRDSTSLTGT